MTIEQVRNFVPEPPKSFLKGPDAEVPTDAFDDLGIHVHYKAPGNCEAVEFALAADPLFEGRHLIDRPFNDILTWFKSLDVSTEVDDTGLTAFNLGIGLYAPKLTENPNAPIEGVIVFEKGYYS